MPTETFEATIEQFSIKARARLEGIVKQSTMDVINIASLPVAKGGRMRVDTGFLRASGQVSLSGMPSGPVRGEGQIGYQPDTSIIALTVASSHLGQTVYFGWTANYAQIREYQDGFLRGATEQWQSIVDKNVAEAIRRYP